MTDIRAYNARMRISIPAVLICSLFAATTAAAQDEAALKQAFEGRRVTLKMDMPATSAGVDVYPQTERPIDYRKYGERISGFGTSIKQGETAIVTLVKLKKDLIEFQLGGGGYDAGNGYVAPEYIAKSNREKQLEKDVKASTRALLIDS